MVILQSINNSRVAYKVTEDEYRELRKFPQRKVGMWEFVREDDEDADHIASATRYPQSAGRRIGELTRMLAAKDAEIAKLREALTPFRRAAGRLFETNAGAREVVFEGPHVKHMPDVDLTAGDFFAVAAALDGDAA